MLKRIHLTVLASALLSTSAFAAGYLPEVTPPAAPAGNWYWDFFGGLALTPNLTTASSMDCGGGLGSLVKYDSAGFDVGTSVGYATGPFRYEAQYNFMRTGQDKIGGVPNSGRTTINAGMANAIYDFQNISDAFSPFIGGGIGFAQIRVNRTGTCSTVQNELAYQGMAGGLFHIDNDFDVTVYYKYFSTNEPANIFTKRFQNHLINFGVIYHIPE